MASQLAPDREFERRRITSRRRSSISTRRDSTRQSTSGPSIDLAINRSEDALNAAQA